jgi:hypothetical protein
MYIYDHMCRGCHREDGYKRRDDITSREEKRSEERNGEIGVHVTIRNCQNYSVHKNLKYF